MSELSWERIDNLIKVHRIAEWDTFWTYGISGSHHQTDSVQVRYLESYLRTLGARTLIVESHYIDRHYMDEFATYYARKRIAPPNHCRRLHAFSTELDDAGFEHRLRTAATGATALESVQKELNDGYLGFIVVRPVANVPIGRTVLRPLQDESARHFPTGVVHIVHLAGLRLSVHGLAFQQQDRAVAACASTAVWSALQSVARRDGGHAPTTSAITEAAVRHLLPAGRPYPSDGLTREQISESLRAFRFPPVLFQFADSPGKFKLLLNIYLRSRIPVIIALCQDDEDNRGHAVTVAGYEEQESVQGVHEVDATFAGITSANLAFDKIYIHDDRLGPYARAKLEMVANRLAVTLELPGNRKETWRIGTAIVPVYEKLRATAEELFENGASFLLPMVNWAAMRKKADIDVTLFFTRSGEYQQSLFDRGIEPERLIRFQKKAVLSRYVGIVRWKLDGQIFLDTIWDTTDRIQATKESFIGLVCYFDDHHNWADALAKYLNGIAG
ncbi:MAG: hypothetical protein HQM03_03520 [Magnetococcales bacterium]|nr:hypothetical protein [Magnetococcales bacterium]